MKKPFLLLLVISMLLSCLAGCNTDKSEGEETTAAALLDTSDTASDGEETTGDDIPPEGVVENTDGTFVNIDLNSVTFPFLKQIAAKTGATEKDLYPFVDQYLDCGVSDLSFNIFCQISQTPTDVWMTVADKYLQTSENGKPVNYKENFGQCYTVLETMGLDYSGIWIDRCNEVGITPWLNIRMNDCHNDGFDTPYFLRDDFFYEADHLPDSYGYYSTCYDYADERVRDRMLRYIEEQLMRYDAHLELDFSREMYCFDYINDPDCHEIMTEFLRDVKAIVEKAEEKWGHDIKILIRLMRDIEQNKAFGFDVEAMAEEELVDIVCPSPRWDTNDSDMPISEWVERFPTLEIYAGLEARTLSQQPTDNATMYGYAANYFAQGADKIYLYNWYANPSNNNITLKTLYMMCSSPDNLTKTTKRYVVTKQDLCPNGYYPFSPLPASISNGAALEVGTAPVEQGKKAEIIIAVDSTKQMTKDTMTIKVNGVECEFAGYAMIQGATYHPSDKVLYKYKIKADLSESNRQKLEFFTDSKSILVYYIEISAQ